MKRTYSLILTLSLVAVLLLSNGSHAQDYDEHLTLIGHTFSVNSIILSPNGSTLASSGNDGTIRLWDATTGIHQKTLTGHTDYVLCIAFNPSGSTLASGGNDGTIRLWDATTGIYQKTLTGHTDSVLTLAFSPNGIILASGGYDNSIRLWDAVTSAQRTLTKPATFEINDLNAERHLQRRLLHIEYETNRLYNNTLPTRSVHSIAFSPNGRLIASGGLIDIHLWDASTGKYMKTLIGHTSKVHSVVFSPDGRVLASASADGTIRLWKLAGITIQ